MELGGGSSAKRKVWPANVKAKEIGKTEAMSRKT